MKLNLSWTKYFPACSTQPWQLDGVVRALLEDGYRPERIHPVENKTVVTNPRKGVIANKWGPVLDRHGLPDIGAVVGTLEFPAAPPAPEAAG